MRLPVHQPRRPPIKVVLRRGLTPQSIPEGCTVVSRRFALNPQARLRPSLHDPMNDTTTDRPSTVGIQTTLKAGISERGAWTRAQLALNGVSWPPLKGWKAMLVRIGYRVPLETHGLFVSLRKPSASINTPSPPLPIHNHVAPATEPTVAPRVSPSAAALPKGVRRLE